MTGNEYLSQMKILYVEDDDDTREDLRMYLRKKAGKVITAADGRAGLVKYVEERPDIVIADILLPEMNGIDMLKEIRRMGGKCPFIITSSVDRSDMIIEAVDIGIVKYAVKPIILDQLLETLNKLAEEMDRGGAVFDDNEQKAELEYRIKQELTAFLKKTTGRGPRDMTVFISDRRIEVTAYGMITPLERSLLEDKHNVSLVESVHGAYYKTQRRKLQFMMKEITGIEVELAHTEFLPLRAVDHIVFNF